MRPMRSAVQGQQGPSDLPAWLIGLLIVAWHPPAHNSSQQPDKDPRTCRLSCHPFQVTSTRIPTALEACLQLPALLSTVMSFNLPTLRRLSSCSRPAKDAASPENGVIPSYLPVPTAAGRAPTVSSLTMSPRRCFLEGKLSVVDSQQPY